MSGSLAVAAAGVLSLNDAAEDVEQVAILWTLDAGHPTNVLPPLARALTDDSTREWGADAIVRLLLTATHNGTLNQPRQAWALVTDQRAEDLFKQFDLTETCPYGGAWLYRLTFTDGGWVVAVSHDRGSTEDLRTVADLWGYAADTAEDLSQWAREYSLGEWDDDIAALEEFAEVARGEMTLAGLAGH